jgi:hypothetical protein
MPWHLNYENFVQLGDNRFRELAKFRASPDVERVVDNGSEVVVHFKDDFEKTDDPELIEIHNLRRKAPILMTQDQFDQGYQWLTDEQLARVGITAHIQPIVPPILEGSGARVVSIFQDNVVLDGLHDITASHTAMNLFLNSIEIYGAFNFPHDGIFQITNVLSPTSVIVHPAPRERTPILSGHPQTYNWRLYNANPLTNMNGDSFRIAEQDYVNQYNFGLDWEYFQKQLEAYALSSLPPPTLPTRRTAWEHITSGILEE